MSKQAPYAQWREELNQLVDDARSRKASGIDADPNGALLQALQVRLLLEQVEALDRIALALDALAAARYG